MYKYNKSQNNTTRSRRCCYRLFWGWALQKRKQQKKKKRDKPQKGRRQKMKEKKFITKNVLKTRNESWSMSSGLSFLLFLFFQREILVFFFHLSIYLSIIIITRREVTYSRRERWEEMGYFFFSLFWISLMATGKRSLTKINVLFWTKKKLFRI